MKVVKRVSTLIRSEVVGREPNQTINALVRPLNVIGFEIVKFPDRTMEAFGILLKIEVSYSAKCHFFLELQYVTFFENNQQRPDLNSLFEFCKEGFANASNVIVQEVEKHKIYFNSKSIAEFKGKELKPLILEELDRQYPK
jgi:hypothetical protein